MTDQVVWLAASFACIVLAALCDLTFHAEKREKKSYLFCKRVARYLVYASLFAAVVFVFKFFFK